MILDYHVRLVCEPTTGTWEYYREVQTDQLDNTIECPAHPGKPTRDFSIEKIIDNEPSCAGNVPTDLTIRTNVGSAIVDDDYAVTAGSGTKFVKIALLRDDGTGDLEIGAFEKITGNYGPIPSGKSLEFDMKEFSVAASGTVLVEEEDWL